MDKDKKALALEIRHLLLDYMGKNKASAVQIADMTGISRHTLARLLEGKKPCNYVTLMVLKHFFEKKEEFVVEGPVALHSMMKRYNKLGNAMVPLQEDEV
jgi:hypothetical protein